MENRSILFGTLCWLLFAYAAPASVFYVDVNSTNPVPPYADWSTASADIQSAVDAATAGDTVLVTNGVYATGGRKWFDSGTNRVTLTNAITLLSVNGPSVTFIAGNQVAGFGPALVNAARCVGMGNNAVLSGFTLTNGEAGTGNYPFGGGVANLTFGNSTVTNCILTGNLVTNSNGGGAYRVKLINCQLIRNSAGFGGGASSCALVNCLVVSNTALQGGGVYGDLTVGASSLTNCTIAGNSATNFGGGAYGSTLVNCSVWGNLAGSRGGGTYSCSLFNSTVVSNVSLFQGGGIDESHGVVNSLIYNNFAGFGPNINGGGSFTNCCTTPLPSFGMNNLTNLPRFVDVVGGNFHLQSNSPCINAGNNAYVSGTNDLDGNPRIVGGTVDIGAYEYQTPSSVLSYAWAQQYGLPTDGTADFADSDGDGMNNYAEWKAGTIPTNAASVLQMASLSNSVTGVTVTWQSVNTRTYYLQSSTNLPFFTFIQSNLVGQAGTTSYTDTAATNGGPYFYRVGVQ